MDGRELIGGPDGEDDEEDEAGEIDGATTAEAGVLADVDHADVSEPHGEREEHFGVAKVGGADGEFGDGGADKKASGHAGQAEEEGATGDAVRSFKRGQTAEGRKFALEPAFLDEVQNAGEKGEQEGGVGGKEEGDVEEDPVGMSERKGFGAGTEGRLEAEQDG